MPNIRGSTRVFAILGDPVEHSRSPAMHNAAFAALGLDCVYVPLRVRPSELRRAVIGIRSVGIAGFNVTVPHKEAILPLLDRLSPAARAIRAVNTVVRQGDRLVGHNTDADGFRRTLRELGFRGAGKRAIVLGAGGSARAVCWALVQEGLKDITILNRDIARARSLALEIRRRRSPRGAAVRTAFGSLAEAGQAHRVNDADLVVNCTSLGLDGRGMPPITLQATPSDCLVYDLVYGAAATPLVREARRRRRTATDGLGMLLEQARLAFEIWTGREPPRRIMARALAKTRGG
jgi:shikimate dehydrogenase